MIDRDFDLNQFVLYLNKQKRMPWKSIFYKVLSFTKAFDCLDCGEVFSGPYLKHCSFHPSKPRFTFGSNLGAFGCCGSKTLRFDPTAQKDGCLVRKH